MSSWTGNGQAEWAGGTTGAGGRGGYGEREVISQWTERLKFEQTKCIRQIGRKWNKGNRERNLG